MAQITTDLSSPMVFVDVETDGMNYVNGHVIEVAAIRVENGEIVDGSRKIVPLSRKESLRIKANENFRAEEEVVKHSILSSSQKAMLLAGISI